MQRFAASDLICGIVVARGKSCLFTYLLRRIKRRLRLRADFSEDFHGRIQVYTWQAHGDIELFFVFVEEFDQHPGQFSVSSFE